MKKFITILLSFSVLFPLVGNAQGTIPEVEEITSIRASIDSVYSSLDKSRVPTGFLQEYAIDFLNFEPYAGALADSNEVSIQLFELLLRGIRSSSVSGTAPFPTVSSILSSMSSTAVADATNPVGILAFRYNYFREDALANNLVAYSNNQVTDVFVDNVWQNPYDESLLFAFSPLSHDVYGNIAYFDFGDYTYTNLNISEMSFDAGDGSGYQTVTSGVRQVTYSSSGKKDLLLRISVAGVYYYAHSSVYVHLQEHPSIVHRRSLRALHPSSPIHIFATEPFEGSTPSAKVTIKLATGHSGLVKPFIIVEGFDPEGISFIGRQEYASFYSSLPEEITDTFDLVYIEWDDCKEDIRANANALVSVIDYVNSLKTGTEKNILYAQSMGGLIARYALCTMEQDSHLHDVNMFISHDVPYLGVNIPLGVLYALQFFCNDNRILLNANTIVRIFQWFADLFGAKSNLVDTYNIINDYFHCKSARQMLLNYVNQSGNIDRSDYLTLQQAFSGMGFPEGDPGSTIKNIAIANGGNPFPPISYFNMDGTIYNIEYWRSILLAITHGDAGHYLLQWPWGEGPRLSVKMNVCPSSIQDNKVFSFLMTFRKRVFLNYWRTYTIHDVEKTRPSYLTPNPDRARGSILAIPSDTVAQAVNNRLYSLTGMSFPEYSVADSILFVPTASALCVGGGNRALTESDYSSVISISDTPFAGIFIDPSATGHTYLSEAATEWILNNLSVSMSGPECPQTGAQYSVYNWTGSITWSVDDPAVATINQSGVLTVISNGHTIVRATLTQGGSTIVLEKRIMTGLPDFVLSITQQNQNGRIISVNAACADSTFFQYVTDNNLVFSYQWGVKRGTEQSPILWDTASTMTWISPKLVDMMFDSHVWIYLKTSCGQLENTNSTSYFSRVPGQPLFLNSNGVLFSQDEDDPPIPVRNGLGDGPRYIISTSGCTSVVFDQQPTSLQVCRELLKQDYFNDLIHTMRPWADKDLLLIPIQIRIIEENQETIIDDVLRILYFSEQ